MVRIRQQILQIAAGRRVPVFICWGKRVGKKLFRRMIHFVSKRRNHRLVKGELRCGCLVSCSNSETVWSLNRDLSQGQFGPKPGKYSNWPTRETIFLANFHGRELGGTGRKMRRRQRAFHAKSLQHVHSFACKCVLISAISSMKIVPLLAQFEIFGFEPNCPRELSLFKSKQFRFEQLNQAAQRRFTFTNG